MSGGTASFDEEEESADSAYLRLSGLSTRAKDGTPRRRGDGSGVVMTSAKANQGLPIRQRSITKSEPHSVKGRMRHTENGKALVSG